MSDGVHVTRQTLSGSEGSAGGLYIMHSASEAIGPGGWGQRPRDKCGVCDDVTG